MKEQELITLLKDFAKRVDYIREGLKGKEDDMNHHLKKLHDTKSQLLGIIDNNVNSILATFSTIELIDHLIEKNSQQMENLSESELSKYEID